jgi:hypothetical protein
VHDRVEARMVLVDARHGIQNLPRIGELQHDPGCGGARRRRHPVQRGDLVTGIHQRTHDRPAELAVRSRDRDPHASTLAGQAAGLMR